MLTQDFGPVRLILPTLTHAIAWRRALDGIKGADLPRSRRISPRPPAWSATAAAALSAITDAEGKRRRGVTSPVARARRACEDSEPGALAVSGLRELGARLL